MRNAILAEPDALDAALRLHERGVDFADALHIAGSRSAGRLAIFDRRLRRQSPSLEGMVEIVEP